MRHHDLIELNRRVAFALWNVTSPPGPPKSLSPRLIFPQLRSGNIRVSEQEARLVWCTMLQDTSYYYAIEAPTAETYVQSGTKPVSARTDLALYELSDSKLHRVANIEFKAHSTTSGQIKKDVEKLIRENKTGNWFHLLSAANSATIPTLFDKFTTALTACGPYVDHDIDIVFCVCILKSRQMLTNRFTFQPGQGDFVDRVREFFSTDEMWEVTSQGLDSK
jgi:hypothetical protein